MSATFEPSGAASDRPAPTASLGMPDDTPGAAIAAPKLGWRLYVRLGLVAFPQVLGLLTVDLVAALFRRRTLGVSAGRRVRSTLGRLGPMFDKVAELMISHASVTPGAMLRGYQSAPAPAYRAIPVATVRSFVDADLGHDALASLTDAPFKVTALAQYHRASLPDGTAVAVKVRRPGIEDTKPPQRMALLLLGLAMRRMLPEGVTVDPMGFMVEIGMGLQRQMDFRNEVGNLDSVARVLHHQGIEGVVIPRPIEGMASERILVTTFVDGTPLDQVADPSTVAALANRGAEVLFACASHGSAFNADLRAGNLVAMPGGTLGIVGFEDCCALDATRAAGLRELLEAVASRDERREVQALDAVGAIPPQVDRRALLARLAWLRREKGDLWGRDPMHGLPHVFQALADFELTVPPSLLRLGEGILHLEAVCRRAGATPDLAAHLPEPRPRTSDSYGPMLTEEEIRTAAVVAEAIGSGSFRDLFRLVPANFRPRKEQLVQQLPFLLILPVFLLWGLRWGLAVLIGHQLATALVTKLRGQQVGAGTKWLIGLATGFGLVGIVSGNQVIAFLPSFLPSVLLYPVLLGSFVAKRPVVGLLVYYLWPLPPAIREDSSLQRRIWILSAVQVTLLIGRQVLAAYLLVTASAATYLTYRQVSNVVSSQANLPIIWLAKRGVAKAPEIEARLRLETQGAPAP